MVRKTKRNRTRKRSRTHRGGTSKPYAIVQYDNRELSDDYKKLVERNREYCKKHNYTHIYVNEGYKEFPPYWRKVALVRNLLKENLYAGILWLDTDACMYNMDRRLETFIEDKYHFYKTDDYMDVSEFCAGVWLVMNSETGLKIMDEWLGYYKMANWRKNNSKNKWNTNAQWAGPVYEQGAFFTNIIPKYRDVIKDLPRDEYQATEYKPGVFIVHFIVPFKERVKDFIKNNQ